MKSHKKTAKPERDSSFVERRWYAYALAGAGAVAAAPPAHAVGIIFTPANTTITASCSGSFCTGASSVLQVDLDNNAVIDFTLQADVVSSAAFLHFAGTGSTAAGAFRNGTNLTTPFLTAGTSIGPAGAGFSYVTAAHILNPSSVWGNGDGYLGLEFHLPSDPNPSDVNYAWAELNLSFNGTNSYSVTLEGFAYQSIPNTPIMAGDTGITPEPGTAGLALLALGACGLAAWRRRKQARRIA
jgi:MYXO-CTERM domain-containing protein